MSDDNASRYRCFVSSCPMFGGIFLNGPQAAPICAWHFGANGHELARITQVLVDWDCIVFEVNTWRCAMLNVTLDPSALAKAWTRLQPALGMSWSGDLAPSASESYAQWGHRLQTFLLGQVKETIRRKAA